MPGVRVLADAALKGEAAENRNTVLLGHPFRSAFTEDPLKVTAVGALEERHVFHNAEHRDIHLAEHHESLHGVKRRDVLRRGDNNGAGDRYLLGKRELNVTGSRRHIDHQIVEIVPVRLLQEIAQGGGDHRTAPDNGWS